MCLCSRAYPARIRYIEGEVGRALRKHSHIVCQADCGVCQTASLVHSRRLSQQQMAAPAAPAAAFNASIGTTSSSQHALAMAGGLPPVGTAAAASSGSLSSSPGRSQLRSPPPSPHYLLPAAGAAERQGGEEWQELEGHWCSIMLIGGQQFSSTATLCMHEYGSWHLVLVDRRGGINSQHMSPLRASRPRPLAPASPPAVMPCRSDKTRSGMARYGHLADGRLKLVLVQQCSPLQVGAVRRMPVRRMPGRRLPGRRLPGRRMPGQRLQGTEALRSTRL